MTDRSPSRAGGGASTPFLVVTAAEREAQGVRRALGTRLGGHPLRLVVTGVGKAAAAFEVGRELSVAPPRLCVHVGCAGAYPASGLALGDVVVATVDCLGDDGADGPEGFRDLADLRFPLYEAEGARVYNEIPLWAPPPRVLEEVQGRAAGRFRVRPGRLVTVSCVTGALQRADFLARRWRAVAESLEGAAVGLACLRGGSPCLEVRGISNEVGAQDRSAWEIDRAVEHAAEVARWIVDAGDFP